MHSLCGQTITVQWGGNTVVATVIDACASCTDNSWIDLSPGAISQLDPNYANSGVLSGITWWFNGGGGGGQATTTTDTPQWTPTSTYTPTETSTWVEPTPTSTYVYTPPAESSSTADYAET
jgi:hypothetical protein